MSWAEGKRAIEEGLPLLEKCFASSPPCTIPSLSTETTRIDLIRNLLQKGKSDANAHQIFVTYAILLPVIEKVLEAYELDPRWPGEDETSNELFGDAEDKEIKGRHLCPQSLTSSLGTKQIRAY